MENKALKLQNEITEETKEDVIKQCTLLSDKLQTEVDKLGLENKDLELKNRMTEETYTTRVKQVLAEYENILIMTSKAESDISLNAAQINDLIDKIAIAQYNADTQRMDAEERKRFNEEQINQWAIENGFDENKLKHEKTKKWTEFTSKVLDAGCRLAGALLQK